MPGNTDKQVAMLTDRRRTHGNWDDFTRTEALICDALEQHGRLTDPRLRGAARMIAHKLARIATGDPCFVDHWDDISGYAQRASEALNGDKTISGGLRHE